MKASELIVQCLENEQVRYVFGLPGEEILDILDSLLDSRITFVPTRHEQGAAFMADAYGRLTGRPGVCLSRADRFAIGDIRASLALAA